MVGMKGGLGKLMQQAQQLQSQMKEMQNEIANMIVEGEAGAGMVKVTMNGRHIVTRLEIDDNLLKEDKETLEDVIVAAFNNAVDKVDKGSKEKMSSLSSGMEVPPGFELPTGE